MVIYHPMNLELDRKTENFPISLLRLILDACETTKPQYPVIFSPHLGIKTLILVRLFRPRDWRVHNPILM